MKNAKDLLTEISTVTRDIETNYPEVYEHLDEIPMTIPDQQNPDIDVKDLENYLESLKDIIKKYKEEH
ncbi:hypothetical protein SAMN04487989_101653 [Bizionia echini]|uniref:Uncharacterized protein n=1 Tax=Bizionia echini TaxID=649333 RepID=A0A1I4Z9U6_9FLAO|nr:hypothetical protein [Bizionia echini]MBP93792.1 hypothetical protein [Flavobacteriaceae bacterium]SFN47061.1 hypothetical protein SAMN04487989_101653 [Bizionia echini]|tara:strand:- start:135 stop:338 length:204 start_codon:yes stop_codon:yes gene_type:complete